MTGERTSRSGALAELLEEMVTGSARVSIRGDTSRLISSAWLGHACCEISESIRGEGRGKGASSILFRTTVCLIFSHWQTIAWPTSAIFHQKATRSFAKDFRDHFIRLSARDSIFQDFFEVTDWSHGQMTACPGRMYATGSGTARTLP